MSGHRLRAGAAGRHPANPRQRCAHRGGRADLRAGHAYPRMCHRSSRQQRPDPGCDHAVRPAGRLDDHQNRQRRHQPDPPPARHAPAPRQAGHGDRDQGQSDHRRPGQRSGGHGRRPIGAADEHAARRWHRDRRTVHRRGHAHHRPRDWPGSPPPDRPPRHDGPPSAGPAGQPGRACAKPTRRRTTSGQVPRWPPATRSTPVRHKRPTRQPRPPAHQWPAPAASPTPVGAWAAAPMPDVAAAPARPPPSAPAEVLLVPSSARSRCPPLRRSLSIQSCPVLSGGPPRGWASATRTPWLSRGRSRGGLDRQEGHRA